MAKLPLAEVPIVDYGADQAAMERYRRDGEQRAMRLGNRGTLRFDCDGKLDGEIAAAYSRCGFYIFEGLLGAARPPRRARRSIARAGRR